MPLFPSAVTYPSDTLFPESGEVAIDWTQYQDKIFETGLDRGVLYPNIGPAVPWLGLTSVDENGAEASIAYYMDGRPYLFVPQPKEFSATIHAYTYPDQFAEMMGLVEATDGMYVDSQQSDSFGLSYRTLIGNPNGPDFGYKIHLIYNATVVPQGITYQSLADTINPTEFSWDIQTVPVSLAGYRSTAHIVIDTRHIDPTKLSLLETLLYGEDLSSAPTLPDPQTIYDLLNYGNIITITNNGDGTWTADGSYHNIYMIGDGIFEITNVNAVLNGDGTYQISSTP